MSSTETRGRLGTRVCVCTAVRESPCLADDLSGLDEFSHAYASHCFNLPICALGIPSPDAKQEAAVPFAVFMGGVLFLLSLPRPAFMASSCLHSLCGEPAGCLQPVLPAIGNSLPLSPAGLPSDPKLTFLKSVLASHS